MQDGNGGNRFGDTGDAEQGSGPNRLFLLHVGVAETASVDQLALSSDGQGGSGRLGALEERRHELVEGFEVRMGDASDREVVLLRLGGELTAPSQPSDGSRREEKGSA